MLHIWCYILPFHAINLIMCWAQFTQLAYPFNLRTAEPFQAYAPGG
jgi:hypothetical protein